MFVALLGHTPPKRSAAELTGDLGMESGSLNRQSRMILLGHGLMSIELRSGEQFPNK